MIRWLGRALAQLAVRWVPDPFSVAILLTLLTLGLTALTMGLGVPEVIGLWGGRLAGGELLPAEKGLWKLLGFGMQMCLILVTGHALATSRPVQAGIDRLAAIPRSQGGAIALTALAAMVAALVNWGLGLIVGALMAREVALAARRRGLRVHYPLLGAAGYTGLMVWHGGLSGSAPLTVTQAKDLAGILGRPDVAPIPLSETLLSPLNLTLTALLLVAVPLMLAMMAPRADADIVEIEPEGLPRAHHELQPTAAATPAERVERSRVLAALLAGLAIAYLALYVSRIGLARIDLNAINLAFLAAGLLLQGTPRAYADAVSDGTRGCAGIILQFPLYAGIMGMMASSGMVASVAETVASASDATTLGPLTLLSAGAVNLFVPSGGGQWAIQGPIVVQSAEALGVPLGHAVMAFAYGDELTNMLQPFWALPLLGITGLAARDLIGYTGALMVLSLPIFVGCLLVF